MIHKNTNLLKNLSKSNYGQVSFLIGTFFLGSALPISIIFYLISIFNSFKNCNLNFFKDNFNKFLFIVSGLIVFSTLNTTLNVSEISSNKTLNTWISLFNWFPLFILFACSKPYLNNALKRSLFAKFLLAGTIPVIASCILQNFFDVVGPFKTSNGLIVWYMDQLNYQDLAVSGLFSNRNYTGVWLSTVFGFSSYEFLILKGNKLKKLFIIFFNFLILYFTIFTFSRNAILSLIIILGIVFKQFKLIISLTSLYIFANILLINTTIYNFFNFNNLVNLKRVFILNLDNILNFNRIEIFSITSNLIWQKPIFGWGGSTFPDMYKLNGGIQAVKHSHNIILELAYNYGIPIAILLSGFVIILLLNSFRMIFPQNNEIKKSLINKCWFASSLVVIVSHLFDITYYDGKISILIWILLSGLKCIIQEEKSNLQSD